MLNIGRNSRKTERRGREFLEAENIEELADIAEVLDADCIQAVQGGACRTTKSRRTREV